MNAPGSKNTIRDVFAVPGLGGFFFDDQAAIKAGAIPDGATYIGQAHTPGYQWVREPAESVSVMLVLDDGYIAYGDCASVQYSGVGGREPRLRAAGATRLINESLAPRLRGLDITSFRRAAAQAEADVAAIEGLGRAAAYGLSQALLDAAAHAAGHHLMARVVQDEWQLTGPLAPVPLYGQTGEERYNNVDKMILKSVDVIPHGLINTPELVGPGGEALERYLQWIIDRVRTLRHDENYLPVLHLDVYGMLGVVASTVEEVADILQRLEAAAAPHALRVEHPVHAQERDAQIKLLSELRRELAARESHVALVADEWANTYDDIVAFATAGAADIIQIKTPDLGSLHHTVDAILACHRNGVGAFLGGTCTETDRSARACVHIGVATGVVQMLAKPGMGLDEGLLIVNNEMQRALALDRAMPRTGA